ncbi:hypothetical protein ACFWOY_34570 [Streptomyces sp. NPDC058423]|uniref:hypothetical protein n=1 Tax=Streptomyces sp. NPDC058423 TaxID=3346490 RepID=UPI0036685F27
MAEALSDARDQQKRIVPVCPYVASSSGGATSTSRARIRDADLLQGSATGFPLSGRPSSPRRTVEYYARGPS